MSGPDIWAIAATRAAWQHPGWAEGPELQRIRRALAGAPPLVPASDVGTLRLLLAEVAAGRLLVIQAGDCAEDPVDNSRLRLSRKVGLVEALAGVMRATTGRPVLRVGRIAGQFAKPRSRLTEWSGGMVLPSYRGPMVNDPLPHPAARRPDPRRMLRCHRSAMISMRYLSEPGEEHRSPRLWTSHEALVLDYEIPQVRPDRDGALVLTSTHWPWVGERTRQPGGAHVRLLSLVSNPVACKVGPDASTADLLSLCRELDPRRERGRLTFIVRMGADIVGDRLPPLVRAVREAGHPVIWLSDPMHGNTLTLANARKTRVVATMLREIREFQRAVAGAGGTAGGLHLEATPDPVSECVMYESEARPCRRPVHHPVRSAAQPASGAGGRAGLGVSARRSVSPCRTRTWPVPPGSGG